MRRPLALIALLFAGCSGDPSMSRLAPGQIVTVLDGQAARFEGEHGEQFPADSDAYKFDLLGTRDFAEVIADDAPDLADESGGRWVRLKLVRMRLVKSLEGLRCRAKRGRLRPVDKLE